MEIRFLGTCAADFSPLLATEFKNKLDKDARRSSSVLVDEHLLIDCGVHTIESLEIQNISLSKVNVLLLTHLHDDHYQSENIRVIAEAACRKLQVYAHRSALPILKKELADSNVEIHALTYGKSRKLKCGITVTALPANHTYFPCHYLLETDTKSVYYAIDGAWIMSDTYRFLKDKKLDIIVLDATVGDYEVDERVAAHNSIPMIRLMMKSIYGFNICDEHTRIILSHIAPSLHASHDETVKRLEKDNMEVAYDGLIIYV